MRNRVAGMLICGLMMTAASMAVGQTPASKLEFDVASVRPSPQPDMQKLIANLNAGIKPESTHIDGSRAAFSYMSLKRLVAFAYGAQPYQISGPDWLPTDRFDIVATLPAGATKESVPAMMQSLLLDRFHLAVRRATLDQQPVLALVADKNGVKLKPATAAPQPVDFSQPLKPGQAIIETPGDPILLTRNPDGSSTYDMGVRGNFSLKFDPDTRSMHMTSNAITMNGVAVMINVLGGGQGREVVNQTQLTDAYEATLEFSLADLLGSLHDDGIDLPSDGGSPAGTATDPEGNATLAASLSRLGLRLDKTRASVTRIVVDSIDKAPTEN